jgi:hypothetical protein
MLENPALGPGWFRWFPGLCLASQASLAAGSWDEAQGAAEHGQRQSPEPSTALGETRHGKKGSADADGNFS